MGLEGDHMTSVRILQTLCLPARQAEKQRRIEELSYHLEASATLVQEAANIKAKKIWADPRYTWEEPICL